MGQFPPKRSVRERLILQIASRLHDHRRQAQPGLPAADVVKIVCISDTHDHVLELPSGDLLLHAGDFSNKGSYEEIQKQLDWLNEQPHEHKVVIAGNHDRLLDDMQNVSTESGKSKADLRWGTLIYLQDAAAVLDFSNGRRLKVYGSPYTPTFGSFAFQYPRDGDFWSGRLPSDADIVLVHGPPLCHLDANLYGGHVGCKSLLKELYRIKPKLVVCGHIHESAGQEILNYNNSQRGFESALLNKAGWGTLANMLLGSFTSTLHGCKQTQLINAAIMEDHRNSAFREAVTVEI